jgi:hypothetical protein
MAQQMHSPVEPDHEEIIRAQNMWGHFTQILTISAAATALTLVVLCVLLVAVWR